jgi:type I restriction enzyme M protein
MSVIDRMIILNALETSELELLAQSFNILDQQPASRKALLDLLGGSEAVTTGQLLMELPRKRLKQLCRKLGLEDGGREKTLIVTRLLGLDPAFPKVPKAVPPIRRRRQ